MEVSSIWRSFRPVSICVITLALAASLACGGSDDNGGNGGDGGGSGGGGGGGGTGQVPNGSRLAWTQAASSPQQLQSMTYRLYVDGGQMTLSAVTCGQTIVGGGYECSGRLPNMSPGAHSLELTSVLDGVESGRSESLRITISATTQVSSAESESSDSEGPSAPSTLVCITEFRECYDAQLIASGLDEPQSLNTLADGRLLFLERGLGVRVVAGNTVMKEPALVPPDPNGNIVGLAVDHSSNGAGSVFVAWTERSPEGSRLNITRYRELHNVLGEGATIVTGLPFPEDAVAPLAVDGDGLLYVAMPSVDAARLPPSERLASDSGAVLRFTRDGRVPESNPRVSPIIAQGYSQPTGLAIDGARNQAWIAGDQSSWPASLAAFPLVSEASATWPYRPQPALQSPRGALRRSTTSLSLVARNGEPGSGSWLIVGFNGQLSRGAVTREGRVEALRPVQFEPAMDVRSVVQGSSDTWYIVTGAERAPGSILRLTRR